MKKVKLLHTIFVCLLVCCGGYVQAQTTMSANANPEVGDQVSVFEAATEGISQGPSGADFSWDFSNLVETKSLVANFVEVSQTPNGSEFGNANIALAFEEPLTFGSTKIMFEYFNSDNGKFNRSGLVNNEGTGLAYDNQQMLLQYPMDYLESYTDEFSATFDVGASTIIQSGTVTVTADAYGSIVLPYGELRDVMRVKIVKDYQEEVGGTNVAFDYLEETYAWYHKDFAYPVLSISTEILDNSPQPRITVVYSAVPRAFVVGVEEEVAKPSFTELFPNPAQNQVSINYGLTASSTVQINVYNAVGQLVSTINNGLRGAGQYTKTIDVSNFARGMYLVELTANGQTSTQKLLVK